MVLQGRGRTRFVGQAYDGLQGQLPGRRSDEQLLLRQRQSWWYRLLHQLADIDSTATADATAAAAITAAAATVASTSTGAESQPTVQDTAQRFSLHVS